MHPGVQWVHGRLAGSRLTLGKPAPTFGRVSRLYRFWREYARRYRWHYALGILFLVATNGLTVAIPGFVEQGIDDLEQGRGASSAAMWGLAILAAGVAIIVVRTLSRTLFFNPGRTVQFRMKNALFDRLLEQSQVFFDRMRPGEIISRGTADTDGVRVLIGFASLQLFNVVLTLLFTLGAMFISNWEVALYCGLPLVAAALVLRVAVRAMWDYIIAVQEQIASLSTNILETYNGAAVVQAFCAEEGAKARFSEQNDELLRLNLKLAAVQAWLLPVVSVVGNLCLVALLWVGGGLVTNDKMTVGELAAFVVYINILVTALTSFGWFINAVQRGFASLGRVYDVIDADNPRPPGELPMPADEDGGYAVSVRGLDFRYPASGDEGDSDKVLEGVSFEAAPGEIVGVFGLTGSGKSTLLNVIGRVYDPPPGTVFVGGTDVRDIRVRDYWDQVAYVPQGAFLFSTSVRDNIALGERGDEIDDARVLEAAEDAALAEELDSLVDGIDTKVGERGITLSGGQRQRTALARAFYRDGKLMLLDDCMSAVDHATEKRLIDAIYKRAEGATTFIVSHRISVLKRADKVIVLDEGRLVATGVHDELAELEGPYRRAWRLQQAEEREQSDAAEAAREVAHGG